MSGAFFLQTDHQQVACLFYYMVVAAAMAKPRSIRDRFPAPWTAEETPAGYCVRDASGAALAYVYGSPQAQLGTLTPQGLTAAEARAIAQAIASLPTRQRS